MAKKLWILCATAIGYSTAVADVSVQFINSSLPQNTTNELGAVTLVFSVDGAGSVTLDASAVSNEQLIKDAVNAWDGPVGTVSFSGAFNTQFSLMLNDIDGSGVKLTNNGGGGLGLGGKNAWRVDRPGIGFISMDTTIASGKLQLKSISWNQRSNTTVDMLLSQPGGSYTNSLDSLSGTWNIGATMSCC